MSRLVCSRVVDPQGKVMKRGCNHGLRDKHGPLIHFTAQHIESPTHYSDKAVFIPDPDLNKTHSIPISDANNIELVPILFLLD